ncbi:aldehyde dehydrogenase family protein [Halioglobus japonicus]|uniref:aldehyde dehydrogenase (NAD(+)) n=1 Tax=Halioglobus japonicus TaxID=930805 RepID=A0AAP8MEU5_9GAMM|nr:aldehyde dehydrogenase family protein [Halioglobus japonicus]AQA18523.1 aldehyde dehydrogenase family protein [Halioglobus japonicus]PLW86543.1 aldehyde dehydrogenase family protein [Halioglobus japonicus]GHD12340.1 aldehyde dehydrogenase [Halioglobus japonicus]
MRDYRQFYIDGQWVDPAIPNDLDVINPANEAPCAVISIGGQSDVDRAVAAAREAFESYSRTTRQERIELLEACVAVYRERYDDIAVAIREEMGSPHTFAVEEQADCGLGHLVEALRVLREFEFEQEMGNTRIFQEPIGVCGLITPWNWPVNQIGCKVAPALAVGCTMVLKPSEVAPLSAWLWSEVMHEAGVPAGVYNMVNGDGPGVGTALSVHPDVDMMSFTGSTRAGVAVAQNAAPTVKRVAQELGGKSPNIVLDDADLEAAVTSGALHMFANTGQSCNAPSRMFVPAAKLAEAEQIAARAAASVVVGDPADPATTMGPVVSKLQFDKIQGLIQQGVDEGARLVAGGTGLPEGLEKGYYVRPTVFSGATNEMVVAREEIFGPVLTMIPYDSEEEAISMANDTVYGLAGYVQSEDLEHARRVASRIRAGNVKINGQWGGYAVPFGGYKQSGNGREWGEHGFADFLEIKAVEGYGD